jgi:hypothetical protein
LERAALARRRRRSEGFALRKEGTVDVYGTRSVAAAGDVNGDGVTSMPVTAVREGFEYLYHIAADDDDAGDTDGDDLEFEVASAPNWLAASASANSLELRGTPSAADAGQADVVLTVRDATPHSQPVEQHRSLGRISSGGSGAVTPGTLLWLAALHFARRRRRR